ncbi:hypothetical protein GCM10008992_19310 [Halorubrum aquaticum]
MYPKIVTKFGIARRDPSVSTRTRSGGHLRASVAAVAWIPTGTTRRLAGVNPSLGDPRKVRYKYERGLVSGAGS